MSAETKPTPTKRTRTVDELWRFVLGGELRRMRVTRGERLEDTAARAGISPQYLSEIERGRKDASSEMIAAVIGALDSTLAHVLVRVSRELEASSRSTQGAQVIDIRSATSVSAPSSTFSSDVSLSVAA